MFAVVHTITSTYNSGETNVVELTADSLHYFQKIQLSMTYMEKTVVV